MSPLFGYKHSREAIDKMRIAGKLRVGKKVGFWGKSHSNEAKDKISKARIGENHPLWKGGRKKSAQGYVLVLNHAYPHANSMGYVLEHRLIMEKKLGRLLLPTEVVHHINGVKDDNREENLRLFKTNDDHLAFHRSPMKDQNGDGRDDRNSTCDSCCLKDPINR